MGVPLPSANDIEKLLRALTDIQNSRLLSATALTLAIYDWALLFPDEYDTILQSRWTVPKGLYYYTRITTPIGIILCTYQLSDLRGPLTSQFCTIWAFLQVLGMFSSMFAANALLALRLIALYRQRRFIVWFIRVFFAASYIATLGIVIDVMITYYGNIFYYQLLKVCGTLKVSRTFPAVFYAPAAFEFFVFALTAYRGWQDVKVISGSGSAPFLIVLYRDGFICFFVMVGIRIWNIWIYLTQPLSSYNLGTQLMWAISTVMTTRVYMNLVWLAKKPLITEGNSMNTCGLLPGSTGIRMRVQTFTDARDDQMDSKYGGFGSMGLHTIASTQNEELEARHC